MKPVRVWLHTASLVFRQCGLVSLSGLDNECSPSVPGANKAHKSPWTLVLNSIDFTQISSQLITGTMFLLVLTCLF